VLAIAFRNASSTLIDRIENAPTSWESALPQPQSAFLSTEHPMSQSSVSSESPSTISLLPPKAKRACTVRSFALTDTGRVRPANEDQFVIVELARTMSIRQTSVPQAKVQYSSHRGHLFIVADGMGGHQAGEVASALGVVTVEDFLLNTLKRFFHLQVPEEQNVMKEFQRALLDADARIFEEANQHPEMLGMGTTLTMAFAVDWRLLIAHVGDSRCYLLSQGELHQFTLDHTMVAELVRLGELSPAQAAHHPKRNVITNVLGGYAPGVHVEMHKLDLEPADVVLLCSDGLSNMVSDSQIAAILAEEQEPQRACERLVAAANEGGGKDNITVVVARFDET
jgi:PPM family protein phosphatase